MRKKKYKIKKHKYGFVVIGEREHTIHKTRKLALYRIEKELEGIVQI